MFKVPSSILNLRRTWSTRLSGSCTSLDLETASLICTHRSNTVAYTENGPTCKGCNCRLSSHKGCIDVCQLLKSAVRSIKLSCHQRRPNFPHLMSFMQKWPYWQVPSWSSGLQHPCHGQVFEFLPAPFCVRGDLSYVHPKRETRHPMRGTDVSARDFFFFFLVAVMGSALEVGWTRHPEPFGKGCCKSCVQKVGACSCAISGPWTAFPLSYRF